MSSIGLSMGLCEHVQDLTQKQLETIAALERMSRTVLNHLRKKYPFSMEWRMLEKLWNGRVLAGVEDSPAMLDVNSGCLLVGIPKDGGRIELLRSKLLLALSRGATNGKACAPETHDTILKEASLLGIQFELPCSDILEYGLMETWGKRVPCHDYRLSWPEFIGLRVDNVIDAFQKSGRRVEAFTWDSMYGKPASNKAIRIIYDPKSRRVVSPAPHIGSIPLPSKEDQCFIKPDEGIACIGAPLSYPPKEWENYVGKLFTEVVDALRMQYPHATIEPLPSTSRVTKDMRRDRIRVRFDPETARVVSIPTIG